MKKVVFWLMLIPVFLFLGACSVQPAASGGTAGYGRFERAERHGQFVPVNRTVDCKGARVTIEKILLDKTGTFMIASVEGDIKGNMDYLTVDLFDHRGRELGRSTLIHKLPGGKTLLTFGPVQSVPEALKLEFFGGPVGYGSGRAILDLKGINLKTVDREFMQEYPLAETAEKPGYRLVLDSVTSGVSETAIRYRISALGDFDGVSHGWLYDWHNNYSPEGELLSLYEGGRKLGIHLISVSCLGPYYRVSRDGKTMAGRANFDPLETPAARITITGVYGYYSMNEIISIDKVRERLDINKEIPVRGYTVELKSFAREKNQKWMLDYTVRNSAGKPVDAAIDAGVYMKADNYRMPLTYFRQFNDAPGGDRRLMLDWQPPEGGDSLIQGPVIKINRLGIRLEDAVLDIDLDHPRKPAASPDETSVMAAVNDYYDSMGNALVRNDVSVMEEKYGYLKPTGKKWDGVNDWRRRLEMWRPMGVKDYSVSFTDPIVTLTANTASVDIVGAEKVQRSGGDSAAGFSVVFYLEKTKGEWKITKVDEFTESELHGVN